MKKSKLKWIIFLAFDIIIISKFAAILPTLLK